MTSTALHSIGLRRWRGSGRRLAGRHATDPTFVRLFARLALAGLIAVAVLAGVAFVIVRDSATSGAIRQAIGLSELAGPGSAEPLITSGGVRGEPADFRRLVWVDAGPIRPRTS